MKQAKQQVDAFGKAAKIAGQVAAAAFIIKQVGELAFELSQLAAKAEGVENAFKRIPASAALLNELTEATKGTVSEFELMQRAVQFNKFGLNLSELPKLLKFASLTAQETGQDVNYLVDSIVTGLGRKSVLILDNLGLSASKINEEVKKTGDFVKAVGNIVDDELPKMGDLLDNNVTKAKNAEAAWHNFRVSLGKFVNETGLVTTVLNSISGALDNFTKGATPEELADITREFKRLRQEAAAKGDLEKWAEYNNLIQQGSDKLKEYIKLTGQNLTDGAGKAVVTVNSLKEAIKALNDQIGQSGSRGAIAELQKAIEEKESELFDLLNGKAKNRPGAITPTSTPKVEAQNPALSINATSAALMNQTNELLKNKAATIESEKSWASWQEQMTNASNMAAELGSSLGGVFADMANDSITAAQAMARAASAILASIERVVIGRMIQKAVEGAGPGPFAIAAAAAAFAAGRALFSKIGSSGGGGGAGGGLAASSSVSTVGEYRSGLSSSSQSSAPVLETQIRGQDLWVVLKNYESSKHSTHG